MNSWILMFAYFTNDQWHPLTIYGSKRDFLEGLGLFQTIIIEDKRQQFYGKFASNYLPSIINHDINGTFLRVRFKDNHCEHRVTKHDMTEMDDISPGIKGDRRTWAKISILTGNKKEMKEWDPAGTQ